MPCLPIVLCRNPRSPEGYYLLGTWTLEGEPTCENWLDPDLFVAKLLPTGSCCRSWAHTAFGHETACFIEEPFFGFAECVPECRCTGKGEMLQLVSTVPMVYYLGQCKDVLDGQHTYFVPYLGNVTRDPDIEDPIESWPSLRVWREGLACHEEPCPKTGACCSKTLRFNWSRDAWEPYSSAQCVMATAIGCQHGEAFSDRLALAPNGTFFGLRTECACRLGDPIGSTRPNDLEYYGDCIGITSEEIPDTRTAANAACTDLRACCRPGCCEMLPCRLCEATDGVCMDATCAELPCDFDPCRRADLHTEINEDGYAEPVTDGVFEFSDGLCEVWSGDVPLDDDNYVTAEICNRFDHNLVEAVRAIDCPVVIDNGYASYECAYITPTRCK